MQVVGFKSLEDFIAEMRAEAFNISGKIVRWEPIKTTDQANWQELDPAHVVWQWAAWATAVRQAPQAVGDATADEPYLMEYGVDLGVDDHTGDLGSRTAAAAKQELADACDDLGLKLRPGKIEVF